MEHDHFFFSLSSAKWLQNFVLWGALRSLYRCCTPLSPLSPLLFRGKHCFSYSDTFYNSRQKLVKSAQLKVHPCSVLPPPPPGIQSKDQYLKILPLSILHLSFCIFSPSLPCSTFLDYSGEPGILHHHMPGVGDGGFFITTLLLLLQGFWARLLSPKRKMRLNELTVWDPS